MPVPVPVPVAVVDVLLVDGGHSIMKVELLVPAITVTVLLG